ncbi:MAG: hypothetical protein ABIL58_08490 [Pseudomonadota bacterium]
MPSGALLILAGSSTRMMNDLFFNRSAPLYGRASNLLQVRPMDYPAFCRACGQDLADPSSFLDRLKTQWAASSLAKRHPASRFEVFGTRVLN